MTSSQSELQTKLSEDVDISLSSDIELTNSFETVDSYSGTLDGNGYTIYNLQTQLVREVSYTAIFKDIHFSDVKLSTNGSIFHRNRGLLQSITVSDLHRKIHIGEREYVGGVVSVNHSTVKECVVTSSRVNGKYKDFDQSANSLDITGGICGKSVQGSKVKDCTVSNTEVFGELKTGGIVGESRGCLIENCELSESDVLGTEKVGGISGISTETEFKDNSVVNSNLETERTKVGGICGETQEENSLMTGCSIKGVMFVSPSEISLLGNIHAKDLDTAIAESCSILESKVVCASNNCELNFFIGQGKIKNCFTSDLKVYSNSVYSNADASISQSYIEATVVGDFSFQDPYSDLNNVYIDITSVEQPTEEIVTVSEASDLSDVNANDTIVLEKDIDCSDTHVDLPVRFSGSLEGNNYTIYKPDGMLFRVLENAEITNCTISEPKETVYTWNGFLSSYMEFSTIENVTVQKTDCDESDFKVCGLGADVKRSTISNCTIKLGGDAVSKCYGLFEVMHTDSEVKNCTVEVTLDCQKEFSGVGKKMSRNSTVSKTETTGQIKLCTKTNYSGLLKENLKGSTVKNCGSNIKVTKKEDVSLLNNVGGLVQKNRAVVKNCIFDGKINLGQIRDEENIVTVGGIVSENLGIIKQCENKAKIYGEADGYVGGICGIFYNKEISECINNGDIKGGFSTGGVIGYVYRSGTLNNIFNNGDVSGTEIVGGLIGKIEKDITVNNSYSSAKLLSKTDQSDPLFGFVEDDAEIDSDELYWNSELNPTLSSKYGTPSSSKPEIFQTILQL